MATITHTAKFPKASQAKAFIARISEPGWSATDIAYSAGGIVTFTAKVAEDQDRWSHWQDWALTVGYYGSSQGRRALLDGIPTPISY